MHQQNSCEQEARGGLRCLIRRLPVLPCECTCVLAGREVRYRWCTAAALRFPCKVLAPSCREAASPNIAQHGAAGPEDPLLWRLSVAQCTTACPCNERHCAEPPVIKRSTLGAPFRLFHRRKTPVAESGGAQLHIAAFSSQQYLPGEVSPGTHRHATHVHARPAIPVFTDDSARVPVRRSFLAQLRRPSSQRVRYALQSHLSSRCALKVMHDIVHANTSDQLQPQQLAPPQRRHTRLSV